MSIHRQSRRKAFGAFVLLAMAGGMATAASAQMPGYNGFNQSERIWKQMDFCKRQAWKEHPDYTREGSAERDKAVRHCLEARNAPPMSPSTPHNPQEGSSTSR